MEKENVGRSGAEMTELTPQEDQKIKELAVDYFEENPLGLPPRPTPADVIEGMRGFGNHPDLSTDFCLEVETLQGWVHDIRAGLRSQWPFWSRLSRLLQFCRDPAFDALDSIAKRARPTAQALGAWGPDQLFDRSLALPDCKPDNQGGT